MIFTIRESVTFPKALHYSVAASEPSLGPTRPRQYIASRQKWAPPSLSSHGRQAGTILLEVCRVRDRKGHKGGHLEGQTVSQLHQSTSQMP
jgi:hypothetical protein